MGKIARSALGERVDFDLLAIKQQLATAPIPVGVSQRRKFIDEKDGIKTKEVIPAPASVDALSVATEAAATSARTAARKAKPSSEE